MAVHSLPLPSFHARWRLGNMLGKVRRRLHHKPVEIQPELFDDQPIWLPESENMHQLRQIFATARRAQARSLGELKTLLPMLENDFPAAAAVLYRLILRLESCEVDCQSWPLNQHSLEALLGVLPPGQLHQLLDYTGEMAAASRPELVSEGRDSLRPEGLWAGLGGNAYLLATLIAFANRPLGREALWTMLHNNSDRSVCSVRFPGQAPVLTAAPTQTEVLLSASAGPQGAWPALLEKAAACLWPFTGPTDDNGPGPMLCAALELLGGKPAELLDTAMTPQSVLRATLARTAEPGMILIAACNQYPWLPVGMLAAEAFAVTDFDADSDRVSLTRAAGQDSPQDAEGHVLGSGEELVMQVPLGAFATYFSHLASLGLD